MKKQLLLATLFSVFATLVSAEPWDTEEEGILQGVDISKRIVIIDAYHFDVAQGSPIRVAGNVSSIAGLARGMKVRYVLRHYDGGDAQVQALGQEQDEVRVVVEIEQLPDSTPILQF